MHHKKKVELCFEHFILSFDLKYKKKPQYNWVHAHLWCFYEREVELFIHIFFIVALPIHHGTATLRQNLFPLYRRSFYAVCLFGNCSWNSTQAVMFHFGLCQFPFMIFNKKKIYLYSEYYLCCLILIFITNKLL